MPAPSEPRFHVGFRASIIALFSSPQQALIFFIAYLVYIQIESYVVSPRVMNRAISNPAALVLTFLFGPAGWLAYNALRVAWRRRSPA